MLDSYQRLAMSTVVAERDELRECLTQQIGRISELEAQAEELLAALKDLVNVFEIRDFVRPAVARARQAIAKAEVQ